MDIGMVLQLFTSATFLAAKVISPLLLTAVCVGLLVSLFQALTQINESTLSFIPKLLVMGLVMWLTLPWMIRELVAFTTNTILLAGEATR